MTQSHQNHLNDKKISLVLVHGFLGSGKTTFLKNLIEQIKTKSGIKIGLLMNDFGEVSIDAIVLNLNLDSGPVIEVNNGSIFCACRHDQFIDALIQILKHPIDLLFIEASGLSDPTPFVSDLAIVQKQTGNKYNVIVNFCVIDVGIFLEMREITPVLDRQIQYADVILLNKLDTIPPEELEQRIDDLVDYVKRLNSHAQIIKTSHSKISLDQFFHLMNLKSIITHRTQPGLDTEESSPLRITLTNIRSVSRVHITDFLDNMISEVLRIKGFLTIDEQMYYLDGLNGHYSLEKLNERKMELGNNLKAELLIIFRLKSDYELVEKVKQIWEEIK